jgi:hypothetical protein
VSRVYSERIILSYVYMKVGIGKQSGSAAVLKVDVKPSTLIKKGEAWELPLFL